jgi:bacterioferritin-associated ferredoxin
MDLQDAFRHSSAALSSKQLERADMIICSCNVLSDKDVKSCVLENSGRAPTPAEVHEQLGSTPQCGCCTKAIRSIVRAETRTTESAH